MNIQDFQEFLRFPRICHENMFLIHKIFYATNLKSLLELATFKINTYGVLALIFGFNEN